MSAPKLNDVVTVTVSGERGHVIGCAQYTNHVPQSLVRYRASDGRAVEAWWDNDAIKVVNAGVEVVEEVIEVVEEVAE